MPLKPTPSSEKDDLTLYFNLSQYKNCLFDPKFNTEKICKFLILNHPIKDDNVDDWVLIMQTCTINSFMLFYEHLFNLEGKEAVSIKNKINKVYKTTISNSLFNDTREKKDFIIHYQKSFERGELGKINNKKKQYKNKSKL